MQNKLTKNIFIENSLFKRCWLIYEFINEVIVYRVMMYANPLLIVQAMYFTSKGPSVYDSTLG